MASSFPPGITGAGADFLKHFYTMLDSPCSSETYAACFSRTATLVMASERVAGRQEIAQLHASLFANDLARTHTITQIFAAAASTTTDNGGLVPDSSDGSIDLMLRGTLLEKQSDGDLRRSGWSAFARLRVQTADTEISGEGGEERVGKLGLDEYRVYVES